MELLEGHVRHGRREGARRGYRGVDAGGDRRELAAVAVAEAGEEHCEAGAEVERFGDERLGGREYAILLQYRFDRLGCHGIPPTAVCRKEWKH